MSTFRATLNGQTYTEPALFEADARTAGKRAPKTSSLARTARQTLRVRYTDTPHEPKAWDAGYVFTFGGRSWVVWCLAVYNGHVWAQPEGEQALSLFRVDRKAGTAHLTTTYAAA